MGSASASGPSLRSRPDRVYKRTAKEAKQSVTSRTKAAYVDFGTRLVLVADGKHDTAEIVTQLARIGYDDVIGVVHDLGSVDLVAYRSVDVYTFVDVLDMDHLQVLDVRAPSEWSAGHLDGSTHRYLPDIRQNDLDLKKHREV